MVIVSDYCFVLTMLMLVAQGETSVESQTEMPAGLEGEIDDTSGRRGVVVSASKCESEGREFESYQSNVDFFQP